MPPLSAEVNSVSRRLSLVFSALGAVRRCAVESVIPPRFSGARKECAKLPIFPIWIAYKMHKTPEKIR